ncbi:MAG: phosphate ABC transporter permease subunit PstC [Terriglobales bacterium]
MASDKIDSPGAVTKVGPVLAPASPHSARSNAVSGFLDRLFKVAMFLCAAAILAVVGLVLYELIVRSRLTLHAYGWQFFVRDAWDPVSGDFGARAFIYGTLVSSAVALVLAVPMAVGTAIFVNEISPRFLRRPISFLVELLAAIPSVIYGLWGIFVLVPVLRNYVEPWLADAFGWTGLFTGPKYGIGMLAGGVILSIMILPIIASITREVMLSVPQNQREAVLALGATRWEMIRTGVLRNARAGILGGVILGLGRAMGETMAVTMVIGNTPQIAKSLFAPATSMAAMIANEFSEATTDMYVSAIIEVGLALFIITVIVNIIARALIWMTTRGMPVRADA